MKKSFFFREGLRQWYLPPAVTMAKAINRLLPLVPFRPASANIMVTHTCNSRCVMCSFWKNSASDELTTAELYSILPQLRRLGVRRVCFSGGEALLRDDLSLLVGEARRLGFEHVQTLTNGLILTESRARELVASGLDRITVSLDGVRQAHDRQRGVEGAYEKTSEALRILTDLRDGEYPGLEVEVATVLTRITQDSLGELLQVCRDLKVTCTIQILENTSFWSRHLKKDSRLAITASESIDSTVDHLHRAKRDGSPLSMIHNHLSLEFVRRYLKGEGWSQSLPDVPCTAALTAIYVNAQGKVYPGCWAMPCQGDLRQESLREIVSAPDYRATMRRMFLKQCPKCPNGFTWSMWYYLPALMREAVLRARFVLGGAKR